MTTAGQGNGHYPGSVLALPTPYLRLCAMAESAGILVRDYDGDRLDWPADTAALVAPDLILLGPDLKDEALAAEVVAFAACVAAEMVTDGSPAKGHEIAAPDGVVAVTTQRIPEHESPQGAAATLFATQCGCDTTSAAFAIRTPGAEEGALAIAEHPECPPWCELSHPEDRWDAHQAMGSVLYGTARLSRRDAPGDGNPFAVDLWQADSADVQVHLTAENYDDGTGVTVLTLDEADQVARAILAATAAAREGHRVISTPEMAGLPPEMLALPGPFERLLATADAMDGVEVGVMPDDTAGEPDGPDPAAYAAYGKHIFLAPDLCTSLAADVLAMAIAVINKMTNMPDAPGDGNIVAPAGWVAISRERLPYDAANVAGRWATEIARRCGRDVASASFRWTVLDSIPDGIEILEEDAAQQRGSAAVGHPL